MGFTSEQFDRLPERFKPQSAKRRPDVISPDAVKLELPLHADIIKFCNEQWPRWKYIHSDPTRPATVEPGTADFIIFAPHGRTWIIECKSEDGKVKPAQRDWSHEIERLGHKYHVVRSMAEFLALVGR